MTESLCGNIIQSKRSFLALGWSVLNILVFFSFLVAFLFALSTRNAPYEGYNEAEDYNNDIKIAVTSRAMAFSALWTVILSAILGIFGTVLLGFQSPTGTYYWCCSLNVHKTTPMVLGIFMGALLMFANLNLVCSVLFGEFEIRDYPKEGNEENNNKAEHAIEKSSLAFSIMCMFLTVLYAGFAGLVYHYADDILEENFADAREEALRPSDSINPIPGYIGGTRFGVSSGPDTTSIQDRFMSPRTVESDNSLM